MISDEREIYHDGVVKRLIQFSIIWAVVGMVVGVWLAAQLIWPGLDFGQFWLTFGRIRPLHTNGIIFGFGVSALMATAFYSLQRTSNVPLFMPRLAWICCYGWQVLVLLGGISLLAGWTSTKEYAELEWPFDIVITILWVCFAVVFFGTIATRRIRSIYVSNWFYGALIIVIAMLHIVNNLALPVSINKSYSLFPGAQDAIVQWWYGHNAVGFLLTGAFLGMLYYFLPKQSGQPIWSYRLSVISFWAFTYTYIWAGPHHLHYNSIPEWVQSLAMVMSLILLAPSWATMINGIMTVSKAWRKLSVDPALKFIVLALAGTMLYILAMWGAGVSQGLLWLSIDDIGELSYSFNDVMAAMVPYYALRLVAGLIFLAGTVLMAYNLFRTMYGRHTVAVSPPQIIDELQGTVYKEEPREPSSGNAQEVPA